MRSEIHRRAIQRRLQELVARLPYEPESRSAYQQLLDEHMRASRSSRHR